MKLDNEILDVMSAITSEIDALKAFNKSLQESSITMKDKSMIITDELFSTIKGLRERNELLLADNRRLREALLEISKGCGTYSADPLQFAASTINSMKALARKAI